MSEAALPEELLRDILKLHLSPSATTFLTLSRAGNPRWADNSAPVRRREPSSALLRVSKRWLRVGTPLLYEAVFLWRPEHTRAVARLLKYNPGVGKAIRYLRVEGGMGRDLATIARLAPNVHTLFLFLSVRSNEGVAGLRKALPLLHPTALYICDGYVRRNKASDEARMLVRRGLSMWTSLEYLNVQHLRFADAEFAAILSNAPALKELHINLGIGNPDWLLQGLLAKIATNGALERVRCDSVLSKHLVDIALANAKISQRVAEMFVYVETASDIMIREAAASLTEADLEHLGDSPSHSESEEDSEGGSDVEDED